MNIIDTLRFPNDKLPAEYPLRTSIKIYSRQLGTFLGSAILSLLLVSIIIGISEIYSVHSSIGQWGVAMVILPTIVFACVIAAIVATVRGGKVGLFIGTKGSMFGEPELSLSDAFIAYAERLSKSYTVLLIGILLLLGGAISTWNAYIIAFAMGFVLFLAGAIVMVKVSGVIRNINAAAVLSNVGAALVLLLSIPVLLLLVPVLPLILLSIWLFISGSKLDNENQAKRPEDRDQNT